MSDATVHRSPIHARGAPRGADSGDMSNRRRPATDKRRPSVTKVKDPADVISVVPYLLGFDPRESLVVIALEGSPQRFGPCARLDLVNGDDPPDAAAHQVDFVAELVDRHKFDPLILVAYTARSRDSDLTDSLMRDLVSRLRADGVEVAEALRADGSRWWSYTCDDRRCCPAEGTPYDAGSSRVAAEAVVAGLARAPSRDALRAQFEPVPARVAAFEDALTGLLAAPTTYEPMTEDDVREQVSRAVEREDPITEESLVRLVLAVQHKQLHDAAWSLMTRANASDHAEFWTAALQAIPDDLLAAVGGLASFAGWLSGRGVLASHAAERVLRVDPDHPMALGVLELCATSVNPAVWGPAPTQARTGSGVER